MLFLPVHPKYASAIAAGTKTVELRRRCPRRLVKGDRIVIYATMPEGRLIGDVEVSSIIHLTPQALWDEVGKLAAITKPDFLSYFTGCEEGVGIGLREFRPFTCTVTLADLRQRWKGFRPPQGFCYLSDDQRPAIKEWFSKAA